MNLEIYLQAIRSNIYFRNIAVKINNVDDKVCFNNQNFKSVNDQVAVIK